MAGDISVGPDYLGRVLANHHDEEDVEPGEVPRSVHEVLSVALAEARAKAMKRVVKTRKAVKSTFTITITDTVMTGNTGGHWTQVQSGSVTNAGTAVGTNAKSITITNSTIQGVN